MNEIAITLREHVGREHRAAQSAMRDAVAHAIRAGELLIEAKAAMPHGAFGEFCRELPFSDRTARGYMRLARLGNEDRQRVADLSLRGALAAISEAPRIAVESARAERATEIGITIEIAYADVGRQIRNDPAAAAGLLEPLQSFGKAGIDDLERALDDASNASDLAGISAVAAAAERACNAFVEHRVRCERAVGLLFREAAR